MPPSLRYLSSFRTPAQRNRSIAEQMRREAKRQQDLNDQEVKRLQKLMQVETQRQQLLESQESDRISREFKVEQQRQRQLESGENDRVGRDFKVEQQRQRDLDGMERFREVEQRQQPGVRGLPISGAGLPAEFQRRLPPGGDGLSIAGIARTAEERVFGPIAAAGLQVTESPIGTQIPGVSQLKDLGRRLEGVGVPEEVSPLPRTRTFGEAFEGGVVNPFAAAFGDEEEQRKAQGVLEEAGLVRGLAARVMFDPSLALPGVGFTKVRTFSNLLKTAIRATGAGRVRAVNALRESEMFQTALKGVREAPEVGGRVPPTGPLRGGELRRFITPERFNPRVVNLKDSTTSFTRFDGIEVRLLGNAGEVTVEFERAGGAPSIKLLGRVREFINEALEANPGTRFVAQPSTERLGQFYQKLGFRVIGEREGKALLQLPPEGLPSRLGGEPSAGPLRGGRVFPEEITPARVSEELKGFEPPTTPPREPPTSPPPPEPPGRPRGPDPDDDSFRAIQDLATKGEKPEITLIRRHEGAINTAKREAAIEVDAGNRLLREAKLGQSFRGTVAPRAGRVDEFDELYRFLHNPSKVESGELVVPERLRASYDKLRELTDWEQVARLDFDPNMALVEDYFYRGWKPPEGMFTGVPARGPLGRKPGFKMPRADATFEEMRAAGFEPIFWNPFEQWRASRMMGIRYREQVRLVEDIKSAGLALEHAGGPIPEGWRVPRIGPAFEGKPFAIVDEAGNPRPLFTRRWVVPDTLADRLENVYRVAEFGTGDVAKIVDALVFIPKRAKLIASVFQHVDFLTRSHIGAWTGFVDALRAGQPINAVKHLAKWPESAYEILRASVSPGFRQKLRRMSLDTSPLVKERPGLTMRSVSEAGLSLQDVTILPANIDEIAREVAQEAVAAKAIKAPGRVLAAFERVHRQGLFQGVYPAAILTDIRNNIAPIVARNYPKLNDAQMAGQIARIANKKYSTIPASMSAIQNRATRGVLTRTFFSLGENEGLLRQAASAVTGPEAAFWRTHWLGAFIGLIGAANVIHFMSTGQALPFARYSPISRDKWGVLPIGYNRDFAAPDIPLTGRSGTEITLDLVGQLDTAFRILDPAGFLAARESVPVRAAVNQITATDFFGAPIDEIGPQGIVSRTTQLAFDMFAPIGIGQSALELARTKIEGAETIIRPGEDRLGTTGTLVQATGVNLRAETTPQLLDRIRADVIREAEIEVAYEDLDLPRKGEVDAEVENRIGEELELRQETAELRGQITPESQFFEKQEDSRIEQEGKQLSDDANLNSGQWPGDVWRDKFRDRQRDFFNQREGLKQAFEIEFEDRERSNKVDIAINTYFDVNVDDYPDVDNPGRTNWGAFFAAQDAALSPLTPTDRKRVEDFIHKFDTPTVKEFRGAQEIVDRFWDMPKYEGLSLKEGQELDKFLNVTVEEFQRRWLREVRSPLERIVAIILAAEQEGLPEALLGVALQLGSRASRELIINPERDEFLIRNERILAKFYPDLLEQQLSRAQEAGLGQQAFEAIAAR